VDNAYILQLIHGIINLSQDKKMSAEIKTWGNDIDKIVSYLQDNRDALEALMSKKQFTSEYAKIRYFSTVVKNGLSTYVMSPPEVIKKTDNEFYESKYKPKPRRKCLSEIIEG